MDIISTTTRVARKRHQCNACLFLFAADYRRLGACVADYRNIAKAAAVKGKIMPGEIYDEVVYEDGGRIFRIRQKPVIDEICRKYDLYFE